MSPTSKLSSASAPTDWFTTTHWSVVLAAGKGPSPEAQQALERLCRSYWYPLYVYVRRQDYSPEDAQDLTQGFFERLLERNYLDDVDRAKGRFRAFLLAALKHFLSDERDRQRAAKRGAGQTILSLDTQSAEERYRLEPVDVSSPDKLYERRWATTLLEQARQRLRREFMAAGKGAILDELKVLEPERVGGPTYAEVGRRLGRTEGAIKAAALRLRQRYGELIREEIAQTVASAGEVDEEIRYLMTVVGG
jgi:DNA-directed RNA polymerase specialized sigma24 family protein